MKNFIDFYLVCHDQLGFKLEVGQGKSYKEFRLKQIDCRVPTYTTYGDSVHIILKGIATQILIDKKNNKAIIK